MQLTEHISLEELTASDTAARLGIDNRCPPELMGNINRLARGVEEARMILGFPVHVNSGYRCEPLNTAVRGSKTSYHKLALAADIICPKFGTPLEICKALAASDIQWDQIIHEFGQWCHIGFAMPGKTPRRQALTIMSAAAGYTPGLT